MKINSGKSNEITKANKRKDQGNKSPNAASSCHQNTDMKRN